MLYRLLGKLDQLASSLTLFRPEPLVNRTMSFFSRFVRLITSNVATSDRECMMPSLTVDGCSSQFGNLSNMDQVM